jgi:two-component system, LytTR family, response regulator
MKMRTIIVDDEPTARRRLSRLLRESGEVELLEECGDAVAALAAIAEHKPDLVFLDVQMPKLNGFEVLAAMKPEDLPVIIFVTAFNRYALRAFEAQALDYLLKPFGEDRVRQAVKRARIFLNGGARHDFRAQLAELLRSATVVRQPPCVLVKRAEGMLLLRAREIDWVEAEGDYVRLHVGQESYLHHATLVAMEQQLKESGFVRIHRSRLVNLDRIREIKPTFRGESLVVLKNGTRVNASQTSLKALREHLIVMGS